MNRKCQQLFAVIISVFLIFQLIPENAAAAAVKTAKASSASSEKAKAAVQPKLSSTELQLWSYGKGTTLKLKGATAASFKSSDKKVATVSSKGRIKPKKAGYATITVRDKKGKKYTCKLTVASVGLEYTDEIYWHPEFSADDYFTSCSVSGIGSCSDKEIVIPRQAPDGKKVVEVAKGAFCYLGELEPEKEGEEETDRRKTARELLDSYSDLSSADNKNITSVSLPDSIIAIRDAAFAGTGLRSVTFSLSVKEICPFSFAFCKNLKLKKIAVKDEIGEAAFAGCDSMTSITVKSDKVMERAFTSCKKLKNVTISGNGVYDCSTFTDCTKLTRAVLPDDMEELPVRMFEGCTSLSRVNFPKNLKHIGWGCFALCRSLREVELPDTLTEIDIGVFDTCTGLRKVKLPRNLEKIGYAAFYDCSSLTSIELPETLKEVEDIAFWGCSNVTEIVLPASLTVMGADVFSNMYKLQSVKLSDEKKLPMIKASLTKERYNNPLVLFDSEGNTLNRTLTVGDRTISAPWDWDMILYLNGCTECLKESTLELFEYAKSLLYGSVGVLSGDSTYTKVKKVHDWLVNEVSYSEKKFFESYDEGMPCSEIVLRTHFGICQGYAEAYYIFMALLGIPCLVVGGDDHCWNLIYMDDGHWYHVDACWDDPGCNDEAWEKGCYSTTNLLRNDAGITETGHPAWLYFDIPAPKADGTLYEDTVDHTIIYER